jgi:hypothetical protein
MCHGSHGGSAPIAPFTGSRETQGEPMTELEQQLLDALQRLEKHYRERDAAMLQRLQPSTARVGALSAQVKQLQRALQRLTTPGTD